jgi:hypothetical protein
MSNGRLDNGRTSPHLRGMNTTSCSVHPAASGYDRWHSGRRSSDAYMMRTLHPFTGRVRGRIAFVWIAYYKADRVQHDAAIATTILRRRRRRRHQRRTSSRRREAATLTWFAWRARVKVRFAVLGVVSAPGSMPSSSVVGRPALNGAPCRCNGLVETRRSCTTPNREKVVTTPTCTVGEGPRVYLTNFLLLRV